MKKIGLIIPNLDGGGAERVAVILANHLNKKEDYEVTIINFDDTPDAYNYTGNRILLDAPIKKTLIGKVLNVPKRVKALKKVKKAMKFDTCISFMGHCNIANIQSRQGEKIILTEHGDTSWRTGLYYFLYKILYKKYYKRADLCISVSDGIRKMLHSYFGVPNELLKTIYNPIDNEEIQKKMNYFSFEEKNSKRKIITMGRLIPKKGIWHLIKAFKIVKEKYENVELQILGKGEQEAELKALVEKLQIKDVNFLGFKKNPFFYMKEADIFVMSSLYEGFPMVLIEAMACGLPIISTDCEFGPRELIGKNNEYGILLPGYPRSNDIDKPINLKDKMLAKNILKLLNNDNQLNYYCKQSKKRAKDFYIENIMKEWEEIL